VPEHSVIPDQQVLFIVIGCKGYVDGRKKRQSKGHRREYEKIDQSVLLEYKRGIGNVKCSDEIHRDLKEGHRRRRDSGVILTLRYEGQGSEDD